MPKFSIIIPVYNVAPYLRECLDSVLSQTFPDWEAICVDDGSTDESGAILDEYAAKDKRFRVFHKENGGVSSARNLALDNAKGEWIGFLDGDDTFVQWALESLCGMINEYKCDLILFGYQKVISHIPLTHKNTNLCNSVNRCYQINDLKSIQDACKSVVGVLLASNGCFKKSVLGRVRFINGMPNGEDVLYGTMCFCRVSDLLVTDSIFYNYLERCNSAVKTMDLRHMESSIKAIVSVAEELFSWKYFGNVRNIVVKKIQTMFYLLVYDLYKNLSKCDRQNGWSLFVSGIKSILQIGLYSKKLEVYTKIAIQNKYLIYCMLIMPWSIKKYLCGLRASFFNCWHKVTSGTK